MNYRNHFDAQWTVAHAQNQAWIRVRLLVGAVCDLGLGHVSRARLGFALVKYEGILVKP